MKDTKIKALLKAMEDFRIKKQIDSEALHLPALKDMIGENVEIIVPVENDSARQKRVPGSAKDIIRISDDFEAPYHGCSFD